MKLFGKKDGNASAPQSDAVDDLGDVDAGFEELDAPAAPDVPLKAPSRGLSAAAGGSRKNVVVLLVLVALLVVGGGYFWFMGESEDTAIHVTATDTAAPPQPMPQPTPDASAMPAADPAAVPAAVAAAAPANADPLAAATPTPVMPASDQAIANADPVTGAPPMPAAPVDPFAAQPAADPAAPVAADPSAVAVAAPADPTAALGAPPADDAVPAVDELTPDAPATAAAPATPDGTVAQAPAATPAPVAAAPGEAAPDWATPGTAVVPGTSNPAAKPTAPSEAELAIVQHADVIDQLSRPAEVGAKPAATTSVSGGGTAADNAANANANADAAKTVSDILEQKGVVRPLPSGYMTIRKESSAGNVDSRLTAARSALAQRRNAAALQLFDELHHDYPKDRRILMGRAVSLQKLGQTDEALAAYEAVLNRDPKNVDALNNMLGLLKKKDPQLALAKLQELHDAYPYQGDITAQLGVAYASTGQYDLALRYLDMAESEKPGMGLVLYNKSVLLDKMGRTREAAALYRQVLRLAADGELGVEVPLDSIRRRLAALQ